ncbi:hypothetical protein AAG906_021647 [Vitis piasezkii]
MESMLSRILIFGGTGYIGRYMVKASVKMGHPTYVYSRPMTPNTSLQDRTSQRVPIHGRELDEHEKLVWVIQQVDVVILALAYPQVLDQLKIIDAIKVAGTTKRFLPSDFGVEEDRVTVLPPFQEVLDKKRIIRRAIEAAGISYTFVSANCFAVLNYEEDTALYTIKVANDPTACNRILELIALWEKKTSRSFKRVHVSEEEVVTLPNPQNIPVAILHSIFVKVSKLYPDINYHTIDQLLDIFSQIPSPRNAAFE